MPSEENALIFCRIKLLNSYSEMYLPFKKLKGILVYQLLLAARWSNQISYVASTTTSPSTSPGAAIKSTFRCKMVRAIHSELFDTASLQIQKDNPRPEIPESVQRVYNNCNNHCDDQRMAKYWDNREHTRCIIKQCDEPYSEALEALRFEWEQDLIDAIAKEAGTSEELETVKELQETHKYYKDIWKLQGGREAKEEDGEEEAEEEAEPMTVWVVAFFVILVVLLLIASR